MKGYKKYNMATLMNDAKIIGSLKVGRMTLTEIGDKINRAPSTTAKIVEAIKNCNRKHAVWQEVELWKEYKALGGMNIPVTDAPVLVDVPALEMKPTKPTKPTEDKYDTIIRLIDEMAEGAKTIVKSLMNK